LGEVDDGAAEASRRHRPIDGRKVVLTEVHRAAGEGSTAEIDAAVAELGVFEKDLARREGSVPEVHLSACEAGAVERDPAAAEGGTVEADGAATEFGESEVDAAAFGEVDIVEDNLVPAVRQNSVSTKTMSPPVKRAPRKSATSMTAPAKSRSHPCQD
jgi:hypothetical protein